MLDSSSFNAFLSTDLFYVEIKASSKSEPPFIEEVHVVHGSHKPEEAKRLKQKINEANWNEVVDELNGLSRFYPLDGEGKNEL